VLRAVTLRQLHVTKFLSEIHSSTDAIPILYLIRTQLGKHFVWQMICTSIA
jgi:hypothetical protein